MLQSLWLHCTHQLLTETGELLSMPPFGPVEKKLHGNITRGAQWLSGRVLDSTPKGSGFEPHRRHCVVVLEQDSFILA